jgi:hypothetical protein
MHSLFSFENLKGRIHLEYLGVYGKIMIERIVGK